MSVFDWVDFFTNPISIFIFGCGAGIFTWFFVGGFLYTINVERQKGITIMTVLTVLAVLLTWGAFIGLVIWYNTPMGPPLELR